jgi:serine/threonine-protein kinase
MAPIDPKLTTALADRYRLERELGAGGMATVYLAHDLKHDRQVALKVLKPELAAVLGAERFVVEIKTTASLSHPHILPLFDSGAADGFLYFVMPFIDGETLREKLNRETQLGVDEAVRITREVADALDHAHRRGVIHRDIKPENILLHDGRAMVADFGIALAVSAAAGGRMTETGLSLGTPHYMSPEQATAEKEITARSDVYSLASVLYEMLAGQPPHLGGSAQQIIMKIITEPAQGVQQLRRSVPPNVAAAVAKALEKLPADRFETAKAFSSALSDPSFATAGSHAAASPGGTRADWRSKAAVPALTLAAALMAVVAWMATRPPAPVQRLARYEVVWSGSAAGAHANFAVSADGSQLVTVREDGRRARLFLRRRSQLESTELPGTDGAFNPSFSPDGRRVAFMVGGTIRVIDLAGGLSTLVTDTLVGVPGLRYGYDGYIYFDVRGLGPLRRVRETGGQAEAVSTLDSAANEAQHVWPDPLPNGRGVIMVINRNGPGQGPSETDGIAVLDLASGKHRELFRGIYARYSTSGHLLYVTREGDLLCVPFDQDRLTVTGPAIPLAKGLAVQTGGSGAVDLAVSSDGTLWYTAGGGGSANREVSWATREGRITSLQPGVAGNIEDVSLSPDGRRVAYILRGSDGASVWMTDLGNGITTRLTFERSYDEVKWAPDGRSVIAIATPGDVYRVDVAGGAPPALVADIPSNLLDARWAPDGKTLVAVAEGVGNFDILRLNPGVDSAAVPLVATPTAERYPSVSPDGRWLLYQEMRGIASDVYVRPFPNTNGSLRQISTAGGRHPRWSPDGREIFYRSYGDSLVSVPVVDGARLETGVARALFSISGVTAWDIAPDGRRFILVRDREEAGLKRLIVVEHFAEELKAKAVP